MSKLIHIGKFLDAITDWKAPYEVAAIVGSDDIKAVEAFLHLMVRLGKAKYGAANNTFRALEPKQ